MIISLPRTLLQPFTLLCCTKKGNNVTLQPMMWGMIPPWHPGPDAKSHGLSTNNCRLESVISSKLYSPCLNSRRCVIVCEGFYEWLRQGSEKQPFLVSRPPKDDCEDGKQLLYMAGLYSIWPEKVTRLFPGFITVCLVSFTQGRFQNGLTLRLT